MTDDSDVIWDLLSALRACAGHVRRGIDDHPLDELDVGLIALASRPETPLRPSDAATILQATAPSITRHVRKLAEQDLVAIEPDPDDRRSYHVTATARGRHFLANFRTDLVATFQPVVADWDRNRITTLAHLLEELNQAMTAATSRRSADAATKQKNWWQHTDKH